MSIAVCVEVQDGIVLAADSAATVIFPQHGPKVYENACKIANLYRGKPIGVVSTGLGGIGGQSVAMIMKDLRERLMAAVAEDGEGGIDPDSYTVQAVANALADHVKRELTAHPLPADTPWDMSFMVGGLSSGSSTPELWEWRMSHAGEQGPVRAAAPPTVECRGVAEWVARLLTGVSPHAPAVLTEHGGMDSQEATSAWNTLRQHLMAPILHPAMPLMDAIELGRFLVETTIGFHRLLPGASVVGGPVEIAAITKHEGFRWIQRKHYYNRDLNPSEVDHARSGCGVDVSRNGGVEQ